MPFELNLINRLTSIAWVNVLLWIGGLLLTLRGIVRHKPLAPSPEEHLTGEHATSEGAPLVSILVPARNEEHRVLSKCIASILAQDYEHAEIIAVNDRSTDQTGTILRRIAAANGGLRVIEGTEPPPGWLGKPHALQQALAVAQGQWILATDADMIFEKSALRTALHHALENRYNAVTLIPHVECLSFWERVFMPVFGWFMLIAMPVERVNDPKRAEALAIGGFFLIHRPWLEQVGAYRSVRADVAEDLRMAERLKNAGARLRIESAPDLLRTRMQTNLAEIWEGFTKNLFAGAKFSVGATIAGSTAVALFAVAPAVVAMWCALMLVTGASGRWLRLLVPTFLVWMLQVITFAVINKRWNVPTRYALTVPLGHLLFVLILLNSALKIVTGNGVTWKGRKLYERTGAVRPPRSV